MNLTPAQLQTLKAHIAANTDTVGGVAIKDLPATADANFAIAAWYNQPATGTEQQAFTAPLSLWKPLVTIQELNTAINWGQNPAGATAADQTNSWLRWQSMCWNNALDLTDPQVRSGIASVWSSGNSNANVKAVGVGRRLGTRAELLFAGVARGPDGNPTDSDTTKNGRVSPVFGQLLTGGGVDAARNS